MRCNIWPGLCDIAIILSQCKLYNAHTGWEEKKFDILSERSFVQEVMGVTIKI